MQQSNSAKFAFFYLLSLVALVFTSLATGIILFQIINKYVIDILSEFGGSFQPEALKFAISALIVACPIYYITMRQIHKSLFSGVLDKESGVRRWLTYFILLITLVIMIGWLIAVVNSFLEGELVLKFFLKALTALAINGIIFSFYLYDIKRKEVVSHKDKIIKIYFYASLALILIVFTTALFLVESPREAKNRKLDYIVLDDFNEIDRAINQYMNEYEKLPSDLESLLSEYRYLDENNLQDPLSKEKYEYKIIEDNKYELCAIFRTSNLEDEAYRYGGQKDRWPHDQGKQCISQKVTILNKEKIINEPVPLMELE